jgi:two-component system nitrate/nitrite response regulator NarL
MAAKAWAPNARTGGAGEGRSLMLAADRTGVPEATAVAVVSRLQLVRDAIGRALEDVGFTVIPLSPPRGTDAVREARRGIIERGRVVGLLATDLAGASEVHEAATLIRDLPLDWLLMTSRPAGALWGALIEGGARDVLNETAHLDDLADRLARVAAGAALTPSPARTAAIAAWAAVPEHDRLQVHRLLQLTAREMEILVELADGDSARRIAARSGVSTGTVHSQIRTVLRKLKVRSTLQAVAAYRHVGDVLNG